MILHHFDRAAECDDTHRQTDPSTIAKMCIAVHAVKRKKVD